MKHEFRLFTRLLIHFLQSDHSEMFWVHVVKQINSVYIYLLVKVSIH